MRAAAVAGSWLAVQHGASELPAASSPGNQTHAAVREAFPAKLQREDTSGKAVERCPVPTVPRQASLSALAGLVAVASVAMGACRCLAARCLWRRPRVRCLRLGKLWR